MSSESHRRTGFTLVEVLIVVVILGILASIVMGRVGNAAEDAKERTVRAQLHTLRSAIVLYDTKNPNDPFNPLGGSGWAQLVDEDYILREPENPLQGGSTVISNAPAMGVGWVWVPGVGNGPGDVYGVDENGNQMPH